MTPNPSSSHVSGSRSFWLVISIFAVAVCLIVMSLVGLRRIAASKAPPQRVSNDATSAWEYRQNVDKLNNVVVEEAILDSLEPAKLPAPYNIDQHLILVIKERGKNAVEALIGVPQGQLVCDGTIPISFDGQEPKPFTCHFPKDQSTNMVFFDDPDLLVNSVKASTKMVCGVSFFQAGSKDFTLNTANLKLGVNSTKTP